MGVHRIEQHHDAHAMRSIDQRLEILRGAGPGGRCGKCGEKCLKWVTRHAHAMRSIEQQLEILRGAGPVSSKEGASVESVTSSVD